MFWQWVTFIIECNTSILPYYYMAIPQYTIYISLHQNVELDWYCHEYIWSRLTTLILVNQPAVTTDRMHQLQISLSSAIEPTTDPDTVANCNCTICWSYTRDKYWVQLTKWFQTYNTDSSDILPSKLRKRIK